MPNEEHCAITDPEKIPAIANAVMDMVVISLLEKVAGEVEGMSHD